MGRDYSPPPPPPADGTSWLVRACWDEDERWWVGEEKLCDTEIEAMGEMRAIGARAQKLGKGDTFLEVSLSRRRWSRGADGVLRWHGSKELVRVESYPPAGPTPVQAKIVGGG